MNHRSNVDRAFARGVTKFPHHLARRNKTSLTKTALYGAIAAVLAVSHAHAADDAADPKAAKTQSLEEVKVTATKRSTSLRSCVYC